MIEKEVVLKKGAYVVLRSALSEINELFSIYNNPRGVFRSDISSIAKICKDANEIIKTMDYIEQEFKERGLK